LNLDPSTFNFGDYNFTGEEYGIGAKELEYIGAPTEYPSMALPIPQGIDSNVQSFPDYGDFPGPVHTSFIHCIYPNILIVLQVSSSGFEPSQALPRLPPPPTSPSHTELGETNVNSAADPELLIAPQDIDLDFNERKFLAGKRRRTQSSRAAGAESSTMPTKKVPHRR
jgi:hypothetical protein